MGRLPTFAQIEIMYARVVLKTGKDGPIRRFHPWIFSGAVAGVSSPLTEGDTVECFAHNGQYLGTGHWADGSLCLKIFSFERAEIDADFWHRKVRRVIEQRMQIGLPKPGITNAFRLIHHEADGFPGLTVDVYDRLAVVQAHTQGMYLARTHIARALIEASGGMLQHVYDKSAAGMEKMGFTGRTDGLLAGSEHSAIILENGHRFAVDASTGQKTGFFLDQRDNRQLLSRYAEGRKVLNMFGYTGGFSVYAAKAGATTSLTVDSSGRAIALAEENLRLNELDPLQHQCIVADARPFLEKNLPGDFDLVILDPPAFAKNVHSKQQALKGYRSLNRLALAGMKAGTMLFTFSCSQAVDRSAFNSVLAAAAIDAGRKVKILHQLAQAADHPVNPFQPESEYLKGLVLWVE